ncbi:ABC transporter substrate-binding protein [Phycicoccus sonneratiae]|uniref:Sugar ABC transporter substrate-binding protein n=1 Tax=Phycicoccus sonneratiae TaxID=2807628 RepID=A0ABS2CN09_9MICO|nr:sugar ABC transporter substrate-binding protein [Phycicoccus sonneraticus]MBM6401205.1 sugar ABC transporter substrate-binding protein [Phycicoccus sonneraticus]
MPLSRRQLLTAAGAATAPLALAACGGFSTSGREEGSDASGTITFTTWGTDAELTGLRAAITSFQQANSGVTVRLNAVPYDQMFTTIDAQLQAGQAPDVFRVPYYTFGSYAGRGQLLDLSAHLEGGFSDRFTPQAWAAVQNGGKPYGVPHHTDTSVVLYNVDLLEAAGVTDVPTRIEDAWTWQEFEAVAKRLRQNLPDDKWPFAYNWQGNGVTRWLSWLFEADGRFLADDLTTPAIDSDAGRAAVEFTQGFFRDGLVPPNSSVKSSTLAADLWYSGTTAMNFGGAFLVPDATSTADFEWGVTFPPRNARSAGDFGGNALVATKGAKDPALVARFLTHVTEKQQMEEFCAGASLLPTRADLVEQGIEFAVRPELSPVFVAQAGAVLPRDSGQVASPSMSAIITVLKDQLEEAFVGDQDAATTVRNLADGIGAATKQ